MCRCPAAMQFFLSLLAYVTTICFAIVTAIASINFIALPPATPPAATQVSAHQQARLTPRERTRQLVVEEAHRVFKRERTRRRAQNGKVHGRSAS